MREEAEYLIDRWEKATTLSSWPMKPVALGLQVGDRSLITRAKALAHRLLKAFYSEVTDRDLVRPEVLPNVVGLSIAAHLDGTEKTALWERIAKAKPPREPVMRALMDVVAQLLKTPKPVGEEAQAKPGQIYREADWLKLLKKEPANRLFDLASSPDHPLWGYTLQPFVLPLGLLLHRQLQALGGETPDILDLYRLGAHPERHPDVIYERQQERPNPLSVPKRAEQSTWFGFDAIEIQQGQARVYHYLGLRWQAPLLFEKNVNAYHFLDSLDLSWRLVESSVPARQWRSLKELRDQGAVLHVVVHDSTKAPAPPQDLARAERHYGVRIEARDLMLA
jgi:hypothetical protein